MPRDSSSLLFKQYVPVNGELVKRKRKREPVPDDLRKRARRACENCRRKKEKCIGGIPCQRCIKTESDCSVSTDSPEWDANAESPNPKLTAAERTRCLEKVLCSYLGVSSVSDEELRSMARSTRKMTPDTAENETSNSDSEDEGFTVDVLSENRIHYSGENSLLTFSRKLGQKIGEPVGQVQRAVEQEQAIISSKAASLQAAVDALPSLEIAQFLVETFFLYGQCNSCFATEGWLNERLKKCYETPSMLSDRDVPSIVTLLMVLAFGSQFVSMRGEITPDLENAYRAVGSRLYEQASTILPEVITAASYDSVQACLILATYLFPIDLPGLAYTYFGLALHMAIKNGMHRKKSHSCRSSIEREIQVRVWWTLYTLLLRTQIYHGRPRTLAPSDVDVERPSLMPELEPTIGSSNFHNQVLLIDITLILEDIAHEISSLRKDHGASHFMRLLTLRQKLIHRSKDLSDLSYHADPAARVDRLRLDIHVSLHYWHARIFLGRPFLLSPRSSRKAPDRSLLVTDAINAALEVIRLCNVLQTRIGLARSSYATEFTCCRAATLVLIAARVTGNNSEEVREALTKGLEIIRIMGKGSVGHQGADARVIEVLRRAIDRLERKERVAKPSNDDNTESLPADATRYLGLSETAILPQDLQNVSISPEGSYGEIRDWQVLWKETTASPTAERSTSAEKLGFDLGMHSAEHPAMQFGAGFENEFWGLPFELNEFSIIPDFNVEL